MDLVPVGLDLGSSQVKCMGNSKRSCFPSVVTTRGANAWEGGEGEISAGFQAVKMGAAYNAESVYPVSHGRPVDIDGYVMLAEHGLKTLGLGGRTDLYIVMGLPYDAKEQREEIQSIFEKKLKIENCQIEPQARGTLRVMKKSTAIVYNIGYGTTEATIFDQSKVSAGGSLPFAINTLFNGLKESGIDVDRRQMGDPAVYEKYERECRPFATKVARAIYNWHTEKMIIAKHDYEVIVAGGGIKNNTVHSALKKTGIEFEVPSDPLYSNVEGHYERAARNC